MLDNKFLLYVFYIYDFKFTFLANTGDMRCCIR